jgi:serine/threonine protein kinase
MSDAGASAPDGSASEKRPPAGEDLTGREIAGCRIIRFLGAGAMGRVYLAEQTGLRRKVAFKVLESRFSRDNTYIERFEREAQAAAQLGHFNIVQVFDFGRREDIYYIVSEYVDGGNVQEIIEEEGLIPPARAAGIVKEACQGLAAAQERTIVHRDIKPDNLMLTKAGVVKVADFGLAKIVEEGAAVTQSGTIVGTPFYMSPEQAKGLPLDHRSDVYGLGVTFYHMVTGQLPFDAESVIGVLLKHISAERPDPCAVVPGLPSRLGKIIMKMMARAPEERYQSARDLIPELDELLAGLSGTPALPARPRRRGGASDRASRYKLLPEERILDITHREVKPDSARAMRSLIKSDAGVFLVTPDLFPEESVVEVQFTVPGRERPFSGIGMVRWIGRDPERTGMGVTFLKVSPLPARRSAGESSRSAVQPPEEDDSGVYDWKDPGEIVQSLSQSSHHARLLQYHYANAGQTVEQARVAGSLGIGMRMLEKVVRPFEKAGLVERPASGIFRLNWPEDEGLQGELVEWIRRYGLR